MPHTERHRQQVEMARELRFRFPTFSEQALANELQTLGGMSETEALEAIRFVADNPDPGSVEFFESFGDPAGFRSAFRAGVGLADEASPLRGTTAGRLLEASQQRLQNLFNIQSVGGLEPGQTSTPAAFGRFAGGLRDPLAQASRARELVRSALGSSRELLADQGIGGGDIGALGGGQGLLATALQGRLAPAAIRSLLNRLPDLQEAFRTANPTLRSAETITGQEPTFLNFLANRFRLGRFLG